MDNVRKVSHFIPPSRTLDLTNAFYLNWPLFRLTKFYEHLLYYSVSQPFFERGTLFVVVSTRGTLTYEAATLRDTFQPPTCANWVFRH
jgi:hypothetical protein